MHHYYRAYSVPLLHSGKGTTFLLHSLDGKSKYRRKQDMNDFIDAFGILTFNRLNLK